jgi:hypothetical protein
MTDMSSQLADAEQQHWTGSPAAQDHERDPALGLIPCPRCTDAVVDLDEHQKTCRDPDTEPEPHADPVADARRIIAQDQQRRMEACLADITAVLEKHGMDLHVEPARLTLVPKD